MIVNILRNPVIAPLLGGLLLISAMDFFLTDASAILGLLPANTFVANKYIWNLFTSCFFEKNFLRLILDIVLLLWVILREGIVVESYEQFGLYMVLCILASTFGTSVYCFIRFFATGLEEMLLEPIYGFSAVLMALSMYVRAYKRDSQLFSNSSDAPTSPQGVFLTKLTYNNLPLVITAVQLLCYCISPLKIFSSDVPFTIICLLFSWSYCRFYYNFHEAGGRNSSDPLLPAGECAPGAAGDSFAFVAMFPTALHVVIVPFSTAFYNLVALVGIFPELVAEERKGPKHHLDRPTQGTASASPLFKDSKPDIAQERRRARALKLLDAKMAELNAAAGSGDGGWDEEEAGPASQASS